MQKQLKIDPKIDTPKIDFDSETNDLYIEGKSFPPDVNEFYNDILAWIDIYINSSPKMTNIHLKLEYFNTSSSKVLMDILYKFEDLHKKSNAVNINWYYPEDDEDMKETGREYSELINIPFKQIGYKYFID